MMAKYKKIETRLDPEYYSMLKAIADKYEISVYGIIQDFINEGIRGCYACGGARAITIFADNEIYDKLSKIAEEYDTTIQNAAWNCMIKYLELSEKRKTEKSTDNKE